MNTIRMPAYLYAYTDFYRVYRTLAALLQVQEHLLDLFYYVIIQFLLCTVPSTCCKLFSTQVAIISFN